MKHIHFSSIFAKKMTFILMGKYFRARTLLVSKLGQNEWHNGKNSLMCHYHQIQGYFNYQLKRKTQERHKMELLKN